MRRRCPTLLLARFIRRDASADALERYRHRWSTLLGIEHAEERRLEAERLHTWTLSRLVKTGFTLTGLVGGLSIGRQYRREVLRFRSKALAQMQQHSFAPGDEAILSRNGPIGADGLLREGAFRAAREEEEGLSCLVRSRERFFFFFFFFFLASDK